MKYFAHIESGRAVDVTAAADVADYEHILGKHGEWQIVEVPEGIQNGASPDGSGGWTNQPSPAKPEPDPVAIELTGGQFDRHCVNQIAGVNQIDPTAALSRYGDIIGALEAITGGIGKIAAKSFTAASAPGGRFSLANVKTLVGTLVMGGALKQEEADAIIANWPKQ